MPLSNNPEDVENGNNKGVRTPEQQKILDRLTKAKSSKERVDVVATALDTFGLDAVAGLIPAYGDAITSVIPGIYLLAEAKRADLDKVDYLKIIALQIADFAIGLVPVAGDAADYAFQANKWSAELFAKKIEKIKQEAVEMGIPPKEIAKISNDGSNLPQLTKQAITMYGKAKSGKTPEGQTTPQTPPVDVAA